MTRPDRNVSRFLRDLAATMPIIGGLSVAILAGLAALIPLPEARVARDLRNGAGMALAIVIGLRLGRRMVRRPGGG
jgi:hypothetical protein